MKKTSDKLEINYSHISYNFSGNKKLMDDLKHIIIEVRILEEENKKLKQNTPNLELLEKKCESVLLYLMPDFLEKASIKQYKNAIEALSTIALNNK